MGHTPEFHDFYRKAGIKDDRHLRLALRSGRGIVQTDNMAVFYTKKPEIRKRLFDNFYRNIDTVPTDFSEGTYSQIPSLVSSGASTPRRPSPERDDNLDTIPRMGFPSVTIKREKRGPILVDPVTMEPVSALNHGVRTSSKLRTSTSVSKPVRESSAFKKMTKEK